MAVDYDDFILLAGEYGTSGNPTKNVNVMNWPTSRSVNIWYDEQVSHPDSLWSGSPYYNASGFGHLHVLMDAWGLVDAEAITVVIYGTIFNLDRTALNSQPVYSVVLTETSQRASITIPVPCEEFYFAGLPSPGTTCGLFLSFYLTWA